MQTTRRLPTIALALALTLALASSRASAQQFPTPAGGIVAGHVNLCLNTLGQAIPCDCPNTAVVNVTAAATTEIVALTASQTIRVCSIAISMTAAGTVTFVNGTGTNCGTGTASLSGAMALATGTPLTISSGNGSVLRPPASNALCVTAATGNVTGFITYAKF